MNKQETLMNQKKEYMKPEAKEVAFFCQRSLLQEASCEGIGCDYDDVYQ